MVATPFKSGQCFLLKNRCRKIKAELEGSQSPLNRVNVSYKMKGVRIYEKEGMSQSPLNRVNVSYNEGGNA